MAKTLDEVAKDVIAGSYGNVDNGRYDKLRSEGYDPTQVQDIVNKMIAGTYTSDTDSTTDSATKVDNGLRDVGLYQDSSGKYGTFQYGKMPTYISKYQDDLDKWSKELTSYQDTLKDYRNKVENFNYDPTSDPTYLNYKDQYIKGGQMAMQDSMAKAAALTGGYGSSYGQSVGQQTYQDYMTGLTDKIPELQQLAYNMVRDKYDLSKDQYSLLQDNYNMYRDLDAQDYSRWGDEYNMWQDAIQQQQYLEQLALAQAQASGGSGGSGGGGYYYGTSGNTDDGSVYQGSGGSAFDYIDSVAQADVNNGKNPAQSINLAKKNVINQIDKSGLSEAEKQKAYKQVRDYVGRTTK